MVDEFNRVRSAKARGGCGVSESERERGGPRPKKRDGGGRPRPPIFFLSPPPPFHFPLSSKDLADLLGTADAPPPLPSAPPPPPPSPLTHIDPTTGRAAMVDVGAKPLTVRSATASARVTLSRAAFEALAADSLAKGDALGVARLAGICAAKRTADLIPLCHAVALSAVAVGAVLHPASASVTLTATASTPPSATGVEMEALTAVSVAALALHDMTKALSPGTVIGPVRLEGKRGGAGGEWVREGEGVGAWRRG